MAEQFSHLARVGDQQVDAGVDVPHPAITFRAKPVDVRSGMNAVALM